VIDVKQRKTELPPIMAKPVIDKIKVTSVTKTDMFTSNFNRQRESKATNALDNNAESI
jgi:hypothetical protein